MRWTMKGASGAAAFAAGLGLFSVPAAAWEDEVSLLEVPAHILQAVQGARAGVVLDSAALVDEDGRNYYELEGDWRGKQLEFQVAPSGEILSIEEEED